MDGELLSKLSDRVLNLIKNTDHRVLITIAGSPGAGKTTCCQAVCKELNARNIKCVVVGMDGYHYPMKRLVELIGEEKAVKFRGAPYTFDAEKVVELARKLKNSTEPIQFDTFDHALKDPTFNGGTVSSDTQVVLFEGNYLHLKSEPWNIIQTLADDSWFIEVDSEVAAQRLAKRHLDAKLVLTLEEGRQRALSNDIPNGLLIQRESTPSKFTLTN